MLELKAASEVINSLHYAAQRWSREGLCLSGRPVRQIVRHDGHNGGAEAGDLGGFEDQLVGSAVQRDSAVDRVDHVLGHVLFIVEGEANRHGDVSLGDDLLELELQILPDPGRGVGRVACVEKADRRIADFVDRT
jgi:hypothetical protein